MLSRCLKAWSIILLQTKKCFLPAILSYVRMIYLMDMHLKFVVAMEILQHKWREFFQSVKFLAWIDMFRTPLQ